MIKIYLIDDDYLRHKELTTLTQKLNGAERHLAFECDRCPTDLDKAKSHATSSIKSMNVWNAVSSAKAGSIFLLDLKLGDLDENQAKVDLSKLLDDSHFEWKTRAFQLMQEASNGGLLSYKTAMFACAVLKARGIDTIIVSTVASVAEVKGLCDAFQIPSAILDEASLSNGASNLEKEILKLVRHPDASVRNILNSYANPIATDPNAWTHDWIQDHRNECLSVLGIKASQLLSDDDAKALFERQRASWSFETADCRVSKSVLQLALKGVGISAEVECDSFNFPVSPGLAFLTALKELISACGNAPPDLVTLGAYEDNIGYPVVNWVRIRLNANACGLAGLQPVCRFLVKIGEAGSDAIVPNGGLSEAVWNLGHCRSSGIRRSGDAWADMFMKGNPNWVAWPSFTPYEIVFHWRRPQGRAN